jgi:hypothetical protein
MKLDFKAAFFGTLILGGVGGLTVFLLHSSKEASNPASSAPVSADSKASAALHAEERPNNTSSDAHDAMASLHEISTNEFDRLKAALGKIEELLPADKIQEQLWAKRKPEYQAVLKTWGLEPEVIGRVEKIIEVREREYTRLRSLFIQAGVGSPQSREIKNSMNEVKAQSARQLQDLLGGDRSQRLQYWENTKEERSHVEKITEIMAQRTVPLNAQQEQSLVDVLYEAKITVAKGRTTRLERLGPAYSFEVAHRASEMLSSDQRSVLQSYLTDIMRR